MTPAEAKDALVEAGYRVYAEDEHNWVLGMCDDDDPLTVPKDGQAVGDLIITMVMSHARINGVHRALAQLLEAIGKKH
jgi:hypothetical protein